MKIINIFDFAPVSTSADPKLRPPSLTYHTLKQAIALLGKEQIIRFEVNQVLFDEICSTFKTAKDPLFKLLNQHTLIYLRYDLIPIILVPDQEEPLKIIKKRRTH